VETGFGRLNRQLQRLQRTLRTRISELEAADRHIAQLEKRCLKLKQAKRDLKQTQSGKASAAEIARTQDRQVILAPYRLPQKN